jgi:hypothetical protein
LWEKDLKLVVTPLHPPPPPLGDIKVLSVTILFQETNCVFPAGTGIHYSESTVHVWHIMTGRIEDQLKASCHR